MFCCLQKQIRFSISVSLSIQIAAALFIQCLLQATVVVRRGVWGGGVPLRARLIPRTLLMMQRWVKKRKKGLNNLMTVRWNRLVKLI